MHRRNRPWALKPRQHQIRNDLIRRKYDIPTIAIRLKIPRWKTYHKWTHYDAIDYLNDTEYIHCELNTLGAYIIALRRDLGTLYAVNYIILRLNT